MLCQCARVSYHDKLIKSEWAWIHSTRMYNNSEDSILTKVTRTHRSQGVARSTRSRTRQRMAGQDEMYNVLKAEERAHNLVSMRYGYIRPSFLHYREVCAELLKDERVKAAAMSPGCPAPVTNTLADGGLDVQAEQEDYMTSKNINNLFVKVVKAILLDKPENPVQFIVDFIGQEYPNQVASVSSGVVTTNDILADPEWRKMCEELAQGRI